MHGHLNVKLNEESTVLRSALVWVITQRIVAIPYRSCLQGSRTQADSCPETSVMNYHYSLRNNVEQRGLPLLSGGSLKSRNYYLDCTVCVCVCVCVCIYIYIYIYIA